MSVGSRLKQQRIRANLEIKEAAHRVGKTYQYVRQIEEGINDPPTWSLLGEFARAYGTSVDYLLELTDNPQPASNDKLPEGAKEVIDYLSSMSDRGREQLLRIAKVVFEDDQDWQQQARATEVFKSFMGEAAFTAFINKFAAVLAETGSAEIAARSAKETFLEAVSNNRG